jgi:hypothetical protein
VFSSRCRHSTLGQLLKGFIILLTYCVSFRF